MNEKQHTEILVGIFMLVGIIAITFLALRMGDFGLLNNTQYTIKAEFTSASGLKKGAHVEMAGVSVGKVKNIIFNPETYLAEVYIAIENNIKIPEDSTASIRTAGIIGDKFLKTMLTMFGIGYFKYAPGTLASFVTCIIYYLI